MEPTNQGEVPQKRCPTDLVFLRAFRHRQYFAKSLAIYAHRHQQRNIAHLATPAALQPQTIEEHLCMVALDRPVAPRLDLRIDLLVQLAHRARADPRPPKASVRSSTRRTLTPARYISTSASSTELSRRR